MRFRKRILAVGLASVLVCAVCCAMVMVSKGGKWPDSWPKELEPLRERATTVDVAHGIQETDYEIPFASREEFERYWPVILKLKGNGAPLILERSPSTYAVSGSTMAAGVRILAPCGGKVEDVPATVAASTQPGAEVASPAAGEMPEYVIVEGGKKVPFVGQRDAGFHFRSRVDLVLVVDGQIVDLNRLVLPTDRKIVDRRFGK